MSGRATFTYRGKTLELLDHPYNSTITNERAVEVPIAWRFVDSAGQRGLEIGNVLSHYHPDGQGAVGRDWRIVDRDEEAPGVDNLDLFAIEGSYDWIVSVSTVEHIRWAENVWAQIAAIYYLRGLLNDGGRMLVTVGLGQTPPLDEWLLSGDTGASFAATLVRDRQGWVETRRLESRPYGPTNGARSVWIGEWEA